MNQEEARVILLTPDGKGKKAKEEALDSLLDMGPFFTWLLGSYRFKEDHGMGFEGSSCPIVIAQVDDRAQYRLQPTNIGPAQLAELHRQWRSRQ